MSPLSYANFLAGSWPRALHAHLRHRGRVRAAQGGHRLLPRLPHPAQIRETSGESTFKCHIDFPLNHTFFDYFKSALQISQRIFSKIDFVSGCPRPHRRFCGGRRDASPAVGEPGDAGGARGGEEHQVAAIRRLKNGQAREGLNHMLSCCFEVGIGRS